jgi:hypothetical protein
MRSHKPSDGFARSPSRATATVVGKAPEQALALLRAALEDGVRLTFVRRGPGYVVTAPTPSGRPGSKVLLELARSHTRPMDAEGADGARWALDKINNIAGRSAGITIRRVEPRHGTFAAYKGTPDLEGCHCDRCRAANTAEHRRYLDRKGAEKPAKEYKHGAACFKRGCTCEESRRASRERQARWRANRRKEKEKASA